MNMRVRSSSPAARATVDKPAGKKSERPTAYLPFSPSVPLGKVEIEIRYIYKPARICGILLNSAPIDGMEIPTRGQELYSSIESVSTKILRPLARKHLESP